MLSKLPEDIKLLILGFTDARCVLNLEVTSRALDLRRNKGQDNIWCGFLRARWPREAPALASLRPRLSARKLYKAFSTKQYARPDIVPSTSTEAYDGEDPNRIVFIVGISQYVGVLRWVPGSTHHADDGWFPMRKVVLQWQPRDGTHFQFELPDDIDEALDEVGEYVQWDLYALDMHSGDCVILTKGNRPSGMFRHDGGIVLSFDHQSIFCHREKHSIAADEAQALKDAGRMDAGSIRVWVLTLNMYLRSSSRLPRGAYCISEVCASTGEHHLATETTPTSHRAFMAEVIRQTHPPASPTDALQLKVDQLAALALANGAPPNLVDLVLSGPPTGVDSIWA